MDKTALVSQPSPDNSEWLDSVLNFVRDNFLQKFPLTLGEKSYMSGMKTVVP